MNLSTATTELRPLGVGEILDRAVRLYRRNFVDFIGIIAIGQVPLAMIQLVISAYNLSHPVYLPRQTYSSSYFNDLAASGALNRLGVQLFLLLLGFILVQGVATAALTRAVADNYLGQKTDMVQAYHKLGGSWLRLLGVLLLMVIVYILLFIWMIIPCVGWLSGPGILIYVAIAVGPLIAPVVVLEKRAGGAIRRAWDLVRRRFWWVLGFMIILVIFNQLIIAGPTYIYNLAARYLFNVQAGSDPTLVTILIQALLSLITGLIYIPLQLTAVTLMYFDLRVRTEGFDLTMLTGAASGEDVGTITSQVVPSKQTGLVYGSELGYFVFLTIITIVGYVALISLLGALGLALGS